MKKFSISFRLQDAPAKTKPIQMITNLGIKDSAGKYLRVITNTGLTLEKSSWDKKQNLPITPALKIKLFNLSNYTIKSLQTRYLIDTDLLHHYTIKELHAFIKGCINYILYNVEAGQIKAYTSTDRFNIEDIIERLNLLVKMENISITDKNGYKLDVSYFNDKLTERYYNELKIKYEQFSDSNFTPTEITQIEETISQPLIKAGTKLFYNYIKEVGELKKNQRLIERIVEYNQLSDIVKEWDDKLPVNRLNNVILTDLINYFYENEPSFSNVQKRKKTLKAVLNNLLSEKQYSNLDINLKLKVYSKTEEESNHPYLTEAQLNTLLNIQFKADEKTLEYVRDLFIVASYTGGVRFTDYKQMFKIGEKKVGKHSIHFIESKSDKTGANVQIPLMDFVYDILKKYDFKFISYTNQTFNRLIKDVCRKAIESDSSFNTDFISYITDVKTNKPVIKMKFFKEENIERIPKLYEVITSHTARRSFCTNMYFHRKIEANTVMAFSGHSDYDTFIKYVKANQNEKFEQFAKEVVIADRIGKG